MTPEQHIARIREWRIGGGDIDLGDAVALCDAYEALAAERNKLQKDYGHLGDQLAYWKGLLDRRSTVLFARAEHAEARYEALAERREAERAVIDAALSSPLYAGSDIWFAVRRLREVTGQ